MPFCRAFTRAIRHRIGVVKNADVDVVPVLREGPLAVLEGICFDACGENASFDECPRLGYDGRSNLCGVASWIIGLADA